MENVLKTNMIRTSQMSDAEFLAFVTKHPVSGGDRAAQSASKAAEKTATSVAGQEQGASNQERSALTPFYRSEMNAEHAYSPNQINELLSAAETPLAASAATTAGKAASEAARTRNTAGYSAALDQAARDRNAAMGKVGLDVASQDVTGAQKLRQEGAEGMSSLFGVDTGAMLKAMGQVPEDINAETDAGKVGWLQNMNETISALTGNKRS